mmetsp:Transcript_19410/g.29294  ORF Transcript_19410/g.29294 Transcript_19410/m.29294 type:complete len:403 (-) Transcript_19410:32-1240(-)
MKTSLHNLFPMTNLFLLLMSAPCVAAFVPPPSAISSHVSSTILFAGGFGTAKSKSAPKKKANKKSKSSILSDIQVDEAPKQSTPKLDRFGLPIPTEDDIFPPLTSDDGARVPVSDGDEFNKEDVAEALQHHIGVNLDIFDENGQSIHEEKSNRWKLKLLHQDPPVLSVENFFSEADVEQYKSMIESNEGNNGGGNGDAVQLSSPTFSSSLSLSRRTSTTWFCKYESMSCLLAKAQALLNVDLKQMEEPQLVRYRTGEEFSWHYDEIPSAQLSNGGQRLATLLVYLNDLDKDRGGGTVFRDLKSPFNESNKRKKKGSSKGNGNQLTVRPKSGTALVFFPAFKDGKPDPRTLHKGEVALDTKMIAQLWIHEKEYQASVPENNLQADAANGVREELERLGVSNVM